MSTDSFVEGDWIVVPLTRGYAVGRLLLRRPRMGTVVLQFLTRRFEDPPVLADLEGEDSTTASHALQCSDGPLRDNAWTNLHGHEVYEPASWPLPWFRYEDPVRRRWWLLRAQRAGDDTSRQYVREVSAEEAEAHPRNVIVSRRQAEQILGELVGVEASCD